MRVGILAAADAIQDSLSSSGVRFQAFFQVLTYAAVDGWAPQHIREYLKRLKQWAARQGSFCAYVWTAEMQERGAVHYNVVVWLKRGLTPPKPDKQGWWPHGMTRSGRLRRPVGYIAKYASKREQKEGWAFPKGLRLWGTGGGSASVRARVSYAIAPAWLRELVPFGTRVIRVGTHWYSYATGIHYPSPWRYVGASGGGALLEWVGIDIDKLFVWGRFKPGGSRPVRLTA